MGRAVEIAVSEELETLYEDLKLALILDESYDLTPQEVKTLLDLLDMLKID